MSEFELTPEAEMMLAAKKLLKAIDKAGRADHRDPDQWQACLEVEAALERMKT